MTTATLTRTEAVRLPAGLGALRARLAEVIARRRAYAATLRELNALTERELNDLGLSRGDIRRVAREAAAL